MSYRTRYQTIIRNFTSAWKLQRDKDKYANRAVAEGMRSRAAYKLEEINDRFGRFLRHVRTSKPNYSYYEKKKAWIVNK